MGRTEALRHAVSDRKDAVLRRSLEVVSGPEGLLVSGPESEVQTYTERVISEVPGSASAEVVPLRLLPAVPGPRQLRRRSGAFLKVAPGARGILAARGVVPTSDGVFRSMLRGANAIRAAHLHWITSAISPRSIINAHATFSVMALRTAVRDTETAIDRVGGTADRVLALAEASRVGDVVGHHRALRRLVRTLDDTGVLTSADWAAVAPIGPMLEVTVERLRAHARRSLESIPPDGPVPDRSRLIATAIDDNRLGETLQLLLVAEGSVYMWQQLRTERVRQAEPEHLHSVVASSREQLKEHSNRDRDIVRALREQLASLGSVRVREIHRLGAAHRLRRSISQLQDDLEEFTESREGQLAGWLDDEDPALAAALNEMRKRATGVGRAARGRLGQVGTQLHSIARPRDD
ncbi:hypothetical protein HT102_02240 [Hoyosella sp. G463]|uniref:Uncharacterized protein n=1 Tax=Lolliginicoccus lacisalsi TaxID=2742202 RepID=A0A927PLD5_9ACTN|nr:hypothetical protein [Lolliginicoccus lacisalsi]MBD8505311.1 hypothetical protein [Lolliginicoccus lacisalsi]